MRQNMGMDFFENKFKGTNRCCVMGDAYCETPSEHVLGIRHYLYELLAILLLLFTLASCTSVTAVSSEITVFAAASLTEALQETAVAFHAQNPNSTIIFNFAGSSQLAAQLSEGAPADIFASANPAQMQNVVAAGRITADSPQPFVTNQLTLIVPAANPAHITSLTDLNQPDLQIIVAVPGVPVRQYTDEIVAKLGADFTAGFYNNVVSEEENVRQVAAKIALGEADAALVYASDVTPDIAQQVQQIAIPAQQNITAIYLIAPVADSQQAELAQQFITFILSSEGQAILAQWGFTPVNA
jgi:molybdate transport system substrate-binding protein